MYIYTYMYICNFYNIWGVKLHSMYRLVLPGDVFRVKEFTDL